MKRILFSLFALVTLSCDFNKSVESKIKGTWKVTKLELASNDSESESIFKNSFVSFYSEGIVSFFNPKNRRNEIYRAGHWDADTEGRLHFSLKQTTVRLSFELLELSNEWMLLKIVNGPPEMLGSVLKCQPWRTYKSKSFDLFNPSSNSWRIKPTTQENTEQIKRRVISHLDFLLGYFIMVKENDLGYFEPTLLQTPFEFYSNGIGLEENFALTNHWASNFYSEENAIEGSKILIEALQSIETYPADENSYTQGYYNAILLMRNFIEK